MIPALRKKQLRASGDFWLAACFTPKDRPLRHLATALADFVEPKAGQLPEQMIDDVEQTLLESNSLAGFLGRYRSRLKLDEGQAPESRDSANLLIFCDQFEEIFREQNRDNPETRQLVDLIVEAHRNRHDYPQLYVIIGMRSEDLHRCAAFIDLPNVINEASYLTRRLDEDEIASAIIEPSRLILRLRGIRPKRFEPIEVDPWPLDVELLQRLNRAVSSLAYNPDHLPLLQHLLCVLWYHVEKKHLLQGERIEHQTAAGFRITPNDLAAALGYSTIAKADEFAHRNKLPAWWILEAALDRAAEGVMPIDYRLKRIAEIMFRLLALVDDRGNYTRRWTHRAEIAAVTRELMVRKRSRFAEIAHGLGQLLGGRRIESDNRPASNDEIETVIRAFTSRYPFLNVREGREGRIDVSHEAFIRNWKTFRNWLADERSLYLAFEAVRKSYAAWREKLLDPHRRWLGWLSAAVFGDRLSSEKLNQMRHWWNHRSPSAAWAARYADGMQDQEIESEHRQSKQISDDLLRSLRRYYRRSRDIRYSILAWPWVLSFFLLVAIVYVFEFGQQAMTSDMQIKAFDPYRLAEEVSKSFKARLENLEVDEQGARQLVISSAKALKDLQDLEGEKEAGLIQPYRRWRQGDHLGLIHSLAKEKSDSAARDAIGSAMWPVHAPSSANSPALAKPAPPECKDALKEYVGDDNAEIGPYVLAPLEEPHGQPLLMVRSRQTSLIFLELSPQPCQVRTVLSATIAPNSEVSPDPNLGVVAVNTNEDGKYVMTRIYRFHWIRRCSPNALPCLPELIAADSVQTIHNNGPYEVIDSNRVMAKWQQYQLRRDQNPALLNPKEAKAALDLFRDKKVTCDRHGPYIAVLTSGKDRPQLASAKDEQFDQLKVFISKSERPCTDYAREGGAIMSFDLGRYSIENAAFAGRGVLSTDTTDGAPDYVYLKSKVPDVVYRLIWNPAKIRSILCEILLRQGGESSYGCDDGDKKG